jgi:hypothetical protein
MDPLAVSDLPTGQEVAFRDTAMAALGIGWPNRRAPLCGPALMQLPAQGRHYDHSMPSVHLIVLVQAEHLDVRFAPFGGVEGPNEEVVVHRHKPFDN